MVSREIIGPIWDTAWRDGELDVSWQNFGYFYFKLDSAKYAVVAIGGLLLTGRDVGKSMAVGTFLLSFLVVTWSFHKISMLLWFLFALGYLYRIGYLKGGSVGRLLIGLCIAGSALIYGVYVVVENTRLETVVHLTGRMNIWITYTSIISNEFSLINILFGAGDKYQYVYAYGGGLDYFFSYHNILLLIFCVYGSIGLFLFMIFLFSLTRDSWNRFNNAGKQSFLVFLVALLVYGITTPVVDNFSHATYLALLLIPIMPLKKEVANESIPSACY